MKSRINKIDPLELNLPNICFSLMKDYEGNDENSKKRTHKYKKQRLERGFDDSETWSLDSTIVSFILPRLKRYFEVASVEIMFEDDFKRDIEIVIEGFEIYKEEGNYPHSIIDLRIKSGHLPNDINIIKSRIDEYSKIIEAPLTDIEFKAYDDYIKVDTAFKIFIEIFPKLWW